MSFNDFGLKKRLKKEGFARLVAFIFLWRLQLSYQNLGTIESMIPSVSVVDAYIANTEMELCHG